LSTRIYLTGRIAFEQDGALAFDEHQLPGRQGRLAFAYLAARPDRSAPRAALIDMLWGDSPPREVDVTLSAVLSRLRGLLRKAAIPGGIEVEHGSVVLRLPTRTWIDIEAAGNAIDEAEGAERRGDLAHAWGHANVASTIARRPFLPAEEAPWIESWRSQLRAVLVRALHCLSTVSADTEPALAVQYAGEIVELEPYRETAYQHLMRLHVRMGNGAEALRVFGHCRKHLRQELGASPSPETERLFLSILRGEPAR
jgi:SARP family transcriptional regulator, regulator of embCAB operon